MQRLNRQAGGARARMNHSPKVVLQPVTPENWMECIRLKVHPSQVDFVATNLYSLAEAKVYPECVPLTFFAGHDMVGFLMYAWSQQDGSYWIIRLMVAQEYQGRGYGRAAMLHVLDILKEKSDCKEIKISYHPNNLVAHSLYASLGFSLTGEILEGEEVASLVVRPE